MKELKQIEKVDKNNKDMYSLLKENITNNKSLLALDRIKEAIDFFNKEKAEYSIAGIARYCVSKYGSPKAQSIRNSENLMKLIKYEQTNRPTRKKVYNDKSDIISLVDDERVKSHIIIQQEEITALRKRYSDLVNAVENMQPLDADKLLKNNLDMDNPVDLSDLNQLVIKNDNISGIEQNVNDFLSGNVVKYEDIGKFIGILNNKFLSNLDIVLELENDMVINSNTGSVLFEFGL